MSCGLNHTLALSADGNTVWAFGDGDYGKLGIDSTTAKPSPRPVDTFTDVGVKRVCCGTQFSAVLTKDGRLFTFGQGKGEVNSAGNSSLRQCAHRYNR